MPKKYQVTLSDGRKFLVEADAPPSEQDVLAALGGNQPSTPPAPEPKSGTPAPKEGRWTDYLDEGGGFIGGLAKVAGPLGALASTPLAAIGGGLGRAAGMGIDSLFYGDKLPENPIEEILKAAGTEGAFNLAGGLLGKGMAKGAKAFYTSTVKPADAVVKSTNAFRKTGSLKKGQDEIAETMLKHSLPLSEAGLEKGWGKVNDLSDEIHGALNTSPATVSKQDVAQDLTAAIAPGGKATIGFAPQGEVAVYQKLLDEVLTNPKYTQTTTTPASFYPPVAATKTVTDLPIPAADAFKDLQETYAKTRTKWGQPAPDNVEALKTLATGARKAIGDAVPEINAPLAKQSELLPALDALNRANKRIGNNNMFSVYDAMTLGTMGLGGATGGAEGMGWSAPIAAWTALRRPMIGGPLARGAYKAAPGMAPASHGLSALIQLLMNQEQQP
jgi:hypothetical protein